jgi:hypothetical protein
MLNLLDKLHGTGVCVAACVLAFFVFESVPSDCGLLHTVAVLALLVVRSCLAVLLPLKLQDLRTTGESLSRSGWSTGTGLFQKPLWSLLLWLLLLAGEGRGGVVGVAVEVVVVAVSGVLGVARCFQNMLLLLLVVGVRGILFRCTLITVGVAGVGGVCILVVLTLVVAIVDGGLGGVLEDVF